ncbi:MAG: hypothetical protein ACE10G_13275, partial [Gemmatimonadales bacterium]
MIAFLRPEGVKDPLVTAWATEMVVFGSRCAARSEHATAGLVCAAAAEMKTVGTIVATDVAKRTGD